MSLDFSTVYEGDLLVVDHESESLSMGSFVRRLGSGSVRLNDWRRLPVYGNVDNVRRPTALESYMFEQLLLTRIYAEQMASSAIDTVLKGPA